MTNKRISYLDTTKGLLMFFLIWGHLIIFANHFDIKTDFFPVIQYSTPFYRVFFMQTFFFITGFCTSWNETFLPFVKKNFRTIILPAFILLPFAWLTGWIIGKDIAAIVETTLGYFTTHMPWFLPALFVTKIMYWVINKYINNEWKRWSIMLTLFITGIYISNYTQITNFWSFQHALVMLPFLALGNLCKKFETHQYNMPIPLINKWGGY